jgi:hypothetical protein
MFFSFGFKVIDYLLCPYVPIVVKRLQENLPSQFF